MYFMNDMIDRVSFLSHLHKKKKGGKENGIHTFIIDKIEKS